jgi:GR25 family glycosyltransferase involved in LPS biosynthesis
MSISEICEFYCLSFNDQQKRTQMINRYNSLNINCHFYDGIKHTDKRINKNLSKFNKRQLSITYGHLDILYDFYHNCNKNYAIISEDDICIHKKFNEIIKRVMNDFVFLNLDILLLGYIVPYKIGNINTYTNFKLKIEIPNTAYFKYHEYPEYLTGTQMYMITKKHAKYLLDKYYLNYLNILNKNFITDKIIIKDGNRAAIYPMLAIEDENQTDLYHQLCHNIHYDEIYI